MIYKNEDASSEKKKEVFAPETAFQIFRPNNNPTPSLRGIMEREGRQATQQQSDVK